MFESITVGGRGDLDALVVGVRKADGGSRAGVRLDAVTKRLDVRGVIAAAVARAECTGEAGRIAEAHPAGCKPARRVIVVGLGSQDEPLIETLPGAIAAVGKRLAQTKDVRIGFEILGAVGKKAGDDELSGRLVGEALGMLAFEPGQFKGVEGGKAAKSKLQLRSSSKAFTIALKRGLAIAESVNLARRLSDTPPNIATPAWMASQAKKMARGIDSLSVTIIKGEGLVREKMTGLVTVGRASSNPPCLIRIAYQPQAGAKKKPAVFVGKTVTYDTGGLSLKINNSMRGMKGDKDGGCAVLGAMRMIATVIKPKRPVVALLCAAENSVSDNAYRPDDIITLRNGVTVEVTNTDAEGRLVLADGLCWAQAKENPAYIVNIATLTGGVVVALGSTYAGMWCEDEELRHRVETASSSCGERVWRMPHHREYRDMMKSLCADIINSSPQRKAHPIQGAAFLSYFVDEKTPWCHLDIAGVNRAESDMGPIVKDTPTAFGARLLAQLSQLD